MGSNSLTTVKNELREKFSAARKAQRRAAAERLSARIAKHVFSLPRVRESDIIMTYHSIGAEVDTAVLMELVIASGRGIALPYSQGGGKLGIGRVWSPDDDLVLGQFGAMEPADRLKDNVRAEQIGVVVCPGVAFDEEGGRLGRGGGVYDRFLGAVKGHALIVGCAFDCQISAEPLPLEEHDVRMDVVVTEKRAFPKGSCPAIRILDEIEAYKESVDIE